MGVEGKEEDVSTEAKGVPEKRNTSGHKATNINSVTTAASRSLFPNNGTPWTEKEIEVLRRVYTRRDIPRKDLEKLFGRSYSSIQKKAIYLGIARNKSSGVDTSELERLKKVYEI